MKKQNKPELAVQKKIARFLKLQYDNGKILEYTATPVHFAKSPIRANINSAMGVRAGFPDFNPIILKDWIVYMEVKAPGEKLRPEQQAILNMLNNRPGIKAVWYDNAEKAIEFLKTLINDVFEPKDLSKESDKKTKQRVDDFSAFIEGTG